MTSTATAWDPAFEAVLRDALPGLPAGELAPGTCLRSAGLDSLTTIDILLRLEAAFDVAVPDEQLTSTTFSTPASLWAVVSAA